MSITDYWGLIFSDEEIKNIKCFENKERTHPLKKVMFPEDDIDKLVSVNTYSALKKIYYQDQIHWIKSLKNRLLDTDDFSHSSSALGEIRALGYLLETGIDANPVPIDKKGKPTPEFLCNYNSETLNIEVHSKQMDYEQAKLLFDFKKRRLQTNKPGSETIEIAPFGEPKKPEDSITLNAISRICGIKESEHQLISDNPQILWLDFQDEYWRIALDEKYLMPLCSFNGEFFSGFFWYAFYGWKGAPVFEGHTLEEKAPIKPYTMMHNGRFRQKTNLSAAILSFPNLTVIYENPFIDKILSNSFIERLCFLHWFANEYSNTRFFSFDLDLKIEMEKETLSKLRNKIVYIG